MIKNDFDKVFENYDVVVGPTAPTTAFNLGEEIDDPLTMYANDLLTTPVNLAGLPGIFRSLWTIKWPTNRFTVHW
ncbi:amidase family protein [Staphylococcus aureus]